MNEMTVFAPGSLFIHTNDGRECEFLVRGCQEIEITTTREIPEIEDGIGHPFLIRTAPMEVTVSARINCSALAFLLGITEQVLGCCSDRSVVHLCKSKRKRTRKKNIRRAFKMLEKQAITEAIK